MQTQRYEFTNFTDKSFTGRYGGVDYTFAPGETRQFDFDKHYMLILLSKQLADRELIKRVKSVGRDPKDMATWGKALDEMGKPFSITGDMRKSLMKQAIGELVDTPVPTPDQVTEEAGTTKDATSDVKSLQDQVQNLTKRVESLVNTLNTQKRTTVDKPSEKVERVMRSASEPKSVTREALLAIARDIGIENTDIMTKEELIQTISGRQAQI